MINGKQMTVTWHVNNLKVSHVDPFQNTKFTVYLASIYGNGLVVHRGQVHDYLGMDLNYTKDGIVQVSMIKYTSKILTKFPKPITTSCATQRQTTSSQCETKMKPNSCQTPKLKLFTTQLLNSYFSANKLNKTSKRQYLSSPHVLSAQTKTIGANSNGSSDTSTELNT